MEQRQGKCIPLPLLHWPHLSKSTQIIYDFGNTPKHFHRYPDREIQTGDFHSSGLHHESPLFIILLPACLLEVTLFWNGRITRLQVRYGLCCGCILC
jgi:hypothetical protein